MWKLRRSLLSVLVCIRISIGVNPVIMFGTQLYIHTVLYVWAFWCCAPTPRKLWILFIFENPSWKYQQWRLQYHCEVVWFLRKLDTSSEDYNITVKAFGFCVILLPYIFFKTNICHWCLSYSKVNIIFNPDYTSLPIPNNITAIKNKVWPLTDVSTWKMIRSFDISLIRGGMPQFYGQYWAYRPRSTNCIVGRLVP